MAGVGQVDPDLMRPAGLECQLDAVPNQVPLDDVPLGARGTAFTCAGRHPLTILLRAPDRGIEDTLRVTQVTPDKRPIPFGDGAGRELIGQVMMSVVVFGDEQATGGVLIEPVDEASLPLTPDAGHFRPMMEERVDERAGWMSGSRVDDQTRRLVDHHAIVVFVHPVEWDRLGRKRRCPLGGLVNDHHRPGRYLLARSLNHHPVDRHAPTIDERLDPRPRKRQQLGEGPIDPRRRRVEPYLVPVSG